MMSSGQVQAKIREAERLARDGHMPAVEAVFEELKADARALAQDDREREIAESFCDVMDATLLVIQVSYMHGGKNVQRKDLIPMAAALERMAKATQHR